MVTRNQKYLRSSSGLVSAAVPEGTEAGAQVLREGGNAVDAAITAAAAVAVAEPQSSGFGGYGGAMLAYLAATGETVCVSFHARAPEAARDGMFELERIADGEMHARDAENRLGPRACGIPSILAGHALALERFGTISLARALEPAVELCERGVANPTTIAAIEGSADLIRRFPATEAILMPGGEPPAPGRPLVQTDLALVLREVQKDGPAAFYEGRVADLMDAYMRESGGAMRKDDWARHDLAAVETPLAVRYRNWDVCTTPECTGGPTLAQILRLARHLELHREDRLSAQYAHLLAEAMKTAWRDRLGRFGDPDFCDCDLERLLADERLVAQATEILGRQTVADDPDEDFWREDGGCTTHVGAADKWGNLVALTQTHGTSFGCGVTIPGTGIILNNAMSRFDPRPGRPNSVSSGKRVLHNMAPALVLKGGKALYSLGLPGGRKIPSVVAQYVMELLDRGGAPLDAIWSAKLHAEACEPVLLEGDRMTEAAFAAEENHYAEADFSLAGGKKRGWPPFTAQDLEARGHDVRFVPVLGGTGHVVRINTLLKLVEAANGPYGDGHIVAA